MKMKMKNLLMTTIAIFGLATFTFSQTLPSYVPSNGLVGWWPFNGNANDESVNSNDGTVSGALLAADRFGISDKAYSFDGINDYIQIPNSQVLQNINTITISAWVNIVQLYQSAGDGFFPIVCKSNINTNGSFRLFFRSTEIVTNFYNQEAASQFSILFNNWQNIVVITDNATTSFYMNGIHLWSGNSITSNNNPINNLPLVIGMDVPGLLEYANGRIDDIGIWNRSLNQQEITNLYNASICANNTTITPQTNTLTTASTAIFNATTSDPNPIYIWQSDLGQGFQTLNDYGNYSGVNTNSLSISNVQLPNHTQPIRVISTSGECIDTSNVAAINITDTCIVTINDTITTLISVTDTLVINTLITGLTPPNNLNTIKVFPNPANSHITIDFGNFESMNGFTLTITNSIGQTVYTTPINEQSSYVDLSTWSGNGIYFVQIIDSQNNTIENRKIVLQ